MYKIDDITKLDLSNKKQYAIAKETLDRYELTQSEKKGLLEGIKNRGGGNYKYFMINYNYAFSHSGLLLSSYADEAYGGMYYWEDTQVGINNVRNNASFLCSFDSAFLLAFKLNIDKIVTNYVGEEFEKIEIKLSEIIDEYLKNEDDPEIPAFLEITEEEYYLKTEIPKFFQISLNTFVDFEKDYKKEASILFDALTKLYNTNINELNVYEYLYIIDTPNGNEYITKIDKVTDDYIRFYSNSDNYYELTKQELIEYGNVG